MTDRLRARRDELAKDVSVNDSYVLKEAPYQRDERLFCEGFDAAVAELWPVVEALQFYANDDNWTVEEDYDGYIVYGVIKNDFDHSKEELRDIPGKQARQALAELGVGEE